MIGKLIGKLFTGILLAGLLGLLALGGYFWHKSGLPMQVDEAQRRVPGITFREFWASRVEQWKKWDKELVAVGKNGTCVKSGNLFFVMRAITSGPFVVDLRAHKKDAKYIRSLVNANNGAVPPANLLYENSFVDAWWAMIEEVAWWSESHNPGFPVKELGQRRACSTTYPTSKDY